MPPEADNRRYRGSSRRVEVGPVTFLAPQEDTDDAQVCGILKPRSGDCDAFAGVVGACLGRE